MTSVIFAKKTLYKTKNFRVDLSLEEADCQFAGFAREYWDGYTEEEIADIVRKLDVTYDLLWFDAHYQLMWIPEEVTIASLWSGPHLYEDLEDFLKNSGNVNYNIREIISEGRETFAAMKKAVEETRMRK